MPTLRTNVLPAKTMLTRLSILLIVWPFLYGASTLSNSPRFLLTACSHSATHHTPNTALSTPLTVYSSSRCVNFPSKVHQLTFPPSALLACDDCTLYLPLAHTAQNYCPAPSSPRFTTSSQSFPYMHTMVRITSQTAHFSHRNANSTAPLLFAYHRRTMRFSPSTYRRSTPFLKRTSSNCCPDISHRLQDLLFPFKYVHTCRTYQSIITYAHNCSPELLPESLIRTACGWKPQRLEIPAPTKIRPHRPRSEMCPHPKRIPSPSSSTAPSTPSSPLLPSSPQCNTCPRSLLNTLSDISYIPHFGLPLFLSRSNLARLTLHPLIYSQGDNKHDTCTSTLSNIAPLSNHCYPLIGSLHLPRPHILLAPYDVPSPGFRILCAMSLREPTMKTTVRITTMCPSPLLNIDP
jgi:hypothetical protein